MAKSFSLPHEEAAGHCCGNYRQNGDRAHMMLSLPARIGPSPRTQLVRGGSDESGSVWVTLVARNPAAGGHRTFAFRPDREGPDPHPAACAGIGHEPLSSEQGAHDGDASLLSWIRTADGSSSEFLAGLIAQQSTGVRLHDPQHEAAVREYRNAARLGQRGASRSRRDTTI
jgi:hypothetical protein